MSEMKTTRPGNCSEYQIMMASYVGDELDEKATAQLEEHLNHCSECRAELARENQLRQTLAQMPLEVCPQRVTRKILEQIEGPESPQEKPRPIPNLHRQWTSYTGWVAAAAAVFLLVVNPWAENAPSPESARPQYTAQEIQAARQDLKYSLRLTAAIIKDTERSTVKEVFGNKLSQSLSRSIKTLMTTPEGGQG